MKWLATLKARFVFIIGVAVLPLLLTTGLAYHYERDITRDTAEEGLRRRLQSILIKESDVAATIRLILGIMNRDNDLRTSSGEDCSLLASRLMQSHLRIANLGAVRLDGTLYCSGVPSEHSVNVADRDWFQAALRRPEMTPGFYGVGRVSGERTVIYGFPELDPLGIPVGALFASVPLDWFDQAFQGLPIPQNWQAAIVTAHGEEAIRLSEVDPDTASRLREDYRQLLATPPRQTEVRQVNLAGRPSLVALAPLPSAPGLYALLSADSATLQAPIDERFAAQVLMILAVAIGSMLLAGSLIHHDFLDWAQRMARTLDRFGSGRLDARNGRISTLRELQALTDHFDVMAARIEHINEELEGRVAARTAELELSNAELEAFAYSISHDLRAPLRAITGFGTILAAEHGARLDATARHQLDNIRGAAAHMDRLIDDLISYARLGHRAAVSLQPVDLAPLLQEVVAFFEPHLDGAQIDLVPSRARPLGDAGLIKQILVNLVDNALKYRAPGVPARIRIDTDVLPDQVTIRVADNGIGIAPEHLDKIFTLFQRLHAETDYPGSGIGLAMARKAARLMHGEIELTSTPGTGSIFSLSLPVAQE